MKKKPALFLDRDGTIIKDKDYLKSPDEVELLDDVLPALKQVQSWGWHLVIISNQSGVARGYFSEKDVEKVQAHLKHILVSQQVNLSGLYYCPHHISGLAPYNIDCNCRKPKTGMIEQAMTDLQIDLPNSIVIGDKLSDIETAKNSNIPGILVKTGYGCSESKKITNISADYVADNLEQAVKWIETIRVKKGTI